MLCKKCKTALRIKNSYYSVSGGNSPETETKLFSVTELFCPNKSCDEFGKIKKYAKPCGIIEEGENIYD